MFGAKLKVPLIFDNCAMVHKRKMKIIRRTENAFARFKLLINVTRPSELGPGRRAARSRFAMVVFDGIQK